jgi:O-antigen/teichoic acid export membrane protein
MLNRPLAQATPRLARWLVHWRPGAYLHASAGLFVWLLLRAAGQAVLVIALARLLGAAGYGHFITVLAVATFFTPLAGLGLQGVLLRAGARNPQGIPQQLRAALRLWWPSTALFGAIGVVVALLALPRGAQTSAVVALVLAEVGSSSLVELLARVHQALHRTHRYGAMLTGLVLARLAALVVYALLARPNLSGWMWAYAASSLAYMTWLLAHAQREFQPARTPSVPAWPLMREGLPFALGALSLRLQAEFNKPVLAQLGFAVAGNFNASQRAVDIAGLPLLAMQEALWARLYASADPKRRMLITSAILVLLALCGGVVLFLLAPLLPLLLGPGFESTVHLLQWLAWLPAVQVMRNFINFQALATYRTHLLTIAYFTAGIASVIFNLFLISRYGPAGAVSAAYLTEFTGIITLAALQHLTHNVAGP